MGEGADAWFDTRAGHGTADAWAQGYKGAGVTMAVLDTGVDFGHPDMHGTWKVLPDGHPYAGWSQAYDPGGVYHYMLDTQTGSTTRLTREARSGIIQTYQTSDVIEKEVDGTLRLTACFRPLMSSRQLGEEDCAYLVPASKCGKPRYGHHPDGVLNGPGSDLDLFVLADRDGDGQFNPQTEILATANGPGGTETLSLGTQPAGAYQVWVHGSSVPGGSSTFDPDLRVISGDDLHLDFAPGTIRAGVPYDFEVCVRDVDTAQAPATREGVVTLGPAGAPAMLTLPVRWTARPAAPPDLLLPALLNGEALGTR